ncbi:hypothetical protein ABW19_dt0207211 [Dactylella cylindrospora]|nr:hypothetical protein ABW19_dt0207211 [Dactylella cylindrospora]
MQMNKLLGFFIASNILFLISGVILIVMGFLWLGHDDTALTVDNAPYVILLWHLPCGAILANGIVVVITFVISIPAVLLPLSVNWLRLHGWMTVVCSMFSLVLGLIVWVDTLAERATMSEMWVDVGPSIQTLLQQKFQCCGYMSSTDPMFVNDSVCTNALVAAQTQPCVGPFTAYEDTFYNGVFTAAFGFVGLDVLVLLCTAMVVKNRNEQRRYRRIDEKRGLGAI